MEAGRQNWELLRRLSRRYIRQTRTLWASDMWQSKIDSPSLRLSSVRIEAAAGGQVTNTVQCCSGWHTVHFNASVVVGIGLPSLLTKGSSFDFIRIPPNEVFDDEIALRASARQLFVAPRRYTQDQWETLISYLDAFCEAPQDGSHGSTDFQSPEPPARSTRRGRHGG